MSQPLSLVERAGGRRLSADPCSQDAFLESSGRALEQRLAEACEGLGIELGPVPKVIARAVGIDGRAGSRWRPLLTLAAAELFGANDSSPHEAAIDVAVAVELTHTASLVLDDMPCMDDSDTRRGVPATHTLVGSAGAILVSIGLLGRAAELIGRTPVAGGRIASDWGGMIGLTGMSGGQALDVAAAGRRLLGAERRLYRAKSTVLPAFALASGARAAGVDDASCEALASFGRSLGWAYQLRDDAADRVEDERLGKRSAAERPLVHSQRIMRFARHRLRHADGLPAEGVEALVSISDRLVPQPTIEPVPGSGVVHGGTR